MDWETVLKAKRRIAAGGTGFPRALCGESYLPPPVRARLPELPGFTNAEGDILIGRTRRNAVTALRGSWKDEERERERLSRPKLGLPGKK